MDNYNNNYNNSNDDNTPPTPYTPDDYQQNYNQNYNQSPGPGTPPPPVKQTNNMAVAAMIVGIFSLLACCMPPLQFVLGVVGIVLVILSKRGKPWSGFAITGLVTSIIALIISIVMVLYLAFAFSMMRDPEFAPIFNDVYQQMYESTPVQ